MSNLPKQLLIGLRLTLFTAALALVYTFVITGISQVAFNNQANGSLVTVNGTVVGSTMIGQSCPKETLASDGSLKITINPKYFQGRLSYTYNASTSDPRAVQCGQLGGQQPRSLQPAPAGEHQERSRGVRGGWRLRSSPDRPGHVGLHRLRPGHQ